MSDELLRDLERAFRATGALDDERRWQLERMRVGALPQARLELAAYVGHEAARRVLGEAAPAAPDKLSEWIVGLARWDFEGVVRAGLAVSRYVLGFADLDAAGSAPLVSLADAVADWLESPTDERLKATAAAARTLTLPVLMRSGTGRMPLQGAFAIQSCLGDLQRYLGRRKKGAGHELSAAASVASGAVQAARVLGGEPDVRAAIRDALAQWALEIHSPRGN